MEPFSDFDEYDGVGMGELVASGEVRPLELVEAAIERVEQWNPIVNAVVHRMYDVARTASEGLDDLPESPLKGVPMVLKDLHASFAGEPMTSACRFLRGHVPDHDSAVVERLKRAGLLVVGKTNAPEMGILGVSEPELFGPARNPWNREHTPGGSSGGSGAAVGAGMVPIGHGGDGGGSLRIPASNCGVFALKPTRGRVPVGPDAGESWLGFDSDGFITRTVRDSAAALDLVAGPDLGAPYHAPPRERPFGEEVGRDPGKLRIAFTGESLYGKTTHPDCTAALEDAVALLEELGHTVEEALPPFDRDAMIAGYFAVVAASVALDIRRASATVGRKADPAEFEAPTWLLGQIGEAMSAADLHEAIETRLLTGRRIAAFMQDYDLVLTPTIAHPPQQIGEGAPKPVERAVMGALKAMPIKGILNKVLDEMGSSALEKIANTMLWNMTGQPAISLPLYWAKSGLPIGVQLAGPGGGEGLLFRIASQLEEARPWKDRRPKLPATSA